MISTRKSASPTQNLVETFVVGFVIPPVPLVFQLTLVSQTQVVHTPTLFPLEAHVVSPQQNLTHAKPLSQLGLVTLQFVMQYRTLANQRTRVFPPPEITVTTTNALPENVSKLKKLQVTIVKL
jgi:hypothetical protein